MSGKLVTPCANKKREGIGGEVAPVEFHCKTPIKTKMMCRRGKKKVLND
jgi:hypothetical protein